MGMGSEHPILGSEPILSCSNLVLRGLVRVAVSWPSGFRRGMLQLEMVGRPSESPVRVVEAQRTAPRMQLLLCVSECYVLSRSLCVSRMRASAAGSRSREALAARTRVVRCTRAHACMLYKSLPFTFNF